MDDELHPADLVEEAFEHDRVLRRQAAQRRMGGRQILEQLLGRGLRRCRPRATSQRRIVSAGSPPRRRAAISARKRDTAVDNSSLRPGASPSQNGIVGAMPMGILDPHHAALDADDAIALVAELKDVAGQAFDREVFVHGADEVVLGLQQHLIVGIVRDGATGRQRGEPCAAPAAQHVVDAVVVDQRAAAAAAGAETFRQHSYHRREILPRQRAIGRCAAHQCIEFVLVPIARGHFRNDLLGQHVERLFRNDKPIELAAADAVEQRRALHQLVAGQRKQPALGRAVDGVPGPADALQEGCDRARRSELADQVDLADVDAQLERSGRHERFQFAVLEPLFGIQALLLGQAAVVRGHLVGRRCARRADASPVRPAGGC